MKFLNYRKIHAVFYLNLTYKSLCLINNNAYDLVSLDLFWLRVYPTKATTVVGLKHAKKEQNVARLYSQNY